MAVGQFVNTWTSRGDEKQDAQAILDARAMYPITALSTFTLKQPCPLNFAKLNTETECVTELMKCIRN